MQYKEMVDRIVRSRNIEIRRLVFRIIHYLQSNPQARDNLSGVSGWWLECNEEEAQAALTYLCSKGFLQCSQHEGQTLFSRNPKFTTEKIPDLISEIPAELS